MEGVLEPIEHATNIDRENLPTMLAALADCPLRITLSLEEAREKAERFERKYVKRQREKRS